MKKITLLLALFLVSTGYSQYSMESLTTYPGSSSGNPKNFILFNNLIYFNSTSDPLSSNAELWRTDGSVSGTMQVADINPGLAGSNPANFKEFNGYLYFTADIFGTTGAELYRTDGITTELFKEFRPGAEGGLENTSHPFVILNDKMYFFARENADGYDLWRTDGTIDGTEKVVNLDISSSPSTGYFLDLNGELFFVMRYASDTIGYELYKYNEATNTVSLIKDINTSIYDSLHISYLTKYDDKIFFSAYNGSQQKLYVTDGTSSGTYAVENTIPLDYNSPKKLHIYNNELYFVATVTGVGTDLYKCKKNIGNQYEIELVYDFNAGGNNNLIPFTNVLVDDEDIFTEFNNELYFAAREQSAPNSGENYQIYKTNGTDTQIAFAMDETVAGPNQQVYYITVFEGKLFFIMKGLGMPQTQLWVANPSDNDVTRLTTYYGTSDQPKMVLPNIRPLVYNNNFYFRAESTNEGYELWKLSDSNLATEKFNDNKLFLYPNPSTGKFNLQSNKSIENASITVSDLNGRIIHQSKVENKSMNLTHLQSGIYILNIKNDDYNYSQKIIKD